MIIRALRAAALICVCASVVGAQERPPDRAADAEPAQSSRLPASESARPPERPVVPEAEDQAETETGAEDAPATDTAPPMFGPPMPPRWWTLRETDQEDSACRMALSYLGTVYRTPPAMTDPDQPDCGIARPIEVTEILPGLTLDGGAVMRCDAARALGFWARDFLRPAAATLPGAPRLIGLQLGTTYDCRRRIGTGNDDPKLSEHGLGNAIDIAGFRLDDGTVLPVLPRRDNGDQAEAFQRAARGAACLFFTTVLGPGTNSAHDDHLHLDVAQRRGGWRLCQ